MGWLCRDLELACMQSARDACPCCRWDTRHNAVVSLHHSTAVWMIGMETKWMAHTCPATVRSKASFPSSIFMGLRYVTAQARHILAA